MNATIQNVDGGPSFRGLGMTYAVGLALMVFGSALLPVYMIGGMGLLMLLAGTVLIGIAVARPYRVPEAVRFKLLGGILLIVGLVGNILLASMSAIVALPIAGTVGAEGPSWVPYVIVLLCWLAWPGLICAGAWLRRRPTRQAILVLWLSLGASYAAITAISSAIFPYLPRRL